MTVSVEMSRRSAAPNRFSCPLMIWRLLCELGEAFGWHREGTTYVIPPKSTVESAARRNYEPGDWQDLKQVGAQDAMAWARALEQAKGSPHALAMLQARSTALAESGTVDDELLPGVIAEFIEFAYGGAFEFALQRVASDESVSR
jgi:hypothetical protein